MNAVNPLSSGSQETGQLQVSVTSQATAYPVPDATISISYTGVPDSMLEQLTTDSSGQTETIDLAAPPLEYSLNEANEQQPYSEYTIQVEAPGYESVSVAGAEILPAVIALQNISLRPLRPSGPEEEVLRRERTQALRQALAGLKTRDRDLFYRKYYYLQSTDRIAAELGTSPRAVEGRLYRIRKKLQAQLGGEDL